MTWPDAPTVVEWFDRVQPAIDRGDDYIEVTEDERRTFELLLIWRDPVRMLNERFTPITCRGVRLLTKSEIAELTQGLV